jgi:hypothetical protein
MLGEALQRQNSRHTIWKLRLKMSIDVPHWVVAFKASCIKKSITKSNLA